MTESSHLTTGQVSELYHVPPWQVRRAADAIEVSIPRAGGYRLIPRSALIPLAVELQRRGWMPKEVCGA